MNEEQRLTIKPNDTDFISGYMPKGGDVIILNSFQGHEDEENEFTSHEISKEQAKQLGQWLIQMSER